MLINVVTYMFEYLYICIANVYCLCNNPIILDFKPMKYLILSYLVPSQILISPTKKNNNKAPWTAAIFQ